MSHLATPLLFALAKDQSLLPSALGHRRLTSPGPLPVPPFHHFQLGLSSLFPCLHHFWGIIRNIRAEIRCDRAQDYANTCENLPILSNTDVDTLQMCAQTHTHTRRHTRTQLLQIVLTGYAAVLCVIRLPFAPVSSNHLDQEACSSQMKLRSPTRVCVTRWPSQSDETC